MDLVDFREDVFDAIRHEFSNVLGRLGITGAWFVPISALTGDNVVRRSRTMSWFDGPALLEHLETVEIAAGPDSLPFRMPVQRVIRPHQDFRGYAGQVASGSIRTGDTVTVFPSGRATRVQSIQTFDGELPRAEAGMSLVLTLDDETDISRGDLITGAGAAPTLSRVFEAHAVWMQEQPLDPAKPYLLKHTSQTVPARVVSIVHRVDINSLEHEPASSLAMNGIGLIRVEASRAIAFDPYRENRITGSAILIDPATNATAGALMIVRAHAAASGPVTDTERAARYGHHPDTVFIGQRKGLARLLERRLFDRGANVAVVNAPAPLLEAAGLIAIVAGDYEPDLPLSLDDETAVDEILQHLEQKGTLLGGLVVADGEGI